VIPDSRNFGFILVAADYAEIPPRPIRDQLDAEQRRRILESLVVCEEYSFQKKLPEHEPSQDIEANHDESLHGLPLPVDSSAGRDCQQPTKPTQDGIEKETELTSIVIPGHEEPVDDSTCAICLDAFLVGELVNHSSLECKHIFHKDCLLGWLDQHDVCPCCRSTMVTEQDWKRAMERELPVVHEHGSRALRQHY
jgi:Ring finger domain